MGGGGLAGALGDFEGNNNMDGLLGVNEGMMEEMAMMNEEEVNGTSNSFKVTVYVNFDEDDDNDHNIDLGDLFKREDLSKPYHVEVS